MLDELNKLNFYHLSQFLFHDFRVDSLSMLAERHPKEFENEVNKLPSNFLYKSEIDKLKEECFESKK